MSIYFSEECDSDDNELESLHDDDNASIWTSSSDSDSTSSDDEDECFSCMDSALSLETNKHSEPAHIQPFMYTPQNYICSGSCVYPAELKTNYSSRKDSPPPPPQNSDIVASDQCLWSSAVVLGHTRLATETHNTSAGSDGFDLGLISDFLSL